jgi:hypothetical protein
MKHCACDLEHGFDVVACPSCGLPTSHEPPPCDGCGARGAGLVREAVEGVVCERRPTCREEGAVP